MWVSEPPLRERISAEPTPQHFFSKSLCFEKSFDILHILNISDLILNISDHILRILNVSDHIFETFETYF